MTEFPIVLYEIFRQALVNLSKYIIKLFQILTNFIPLLDRKTLLIFDQNEITM